MTTQNTRSAERVPVEAFVIVRDGADELVFRTRDLSATGLFLFTRVARAYRFRVGSALELEFYDDTATFRCKVVIARVVEPGSAEADRFPTGFGVHITECDDANRERLAGLVAQLRKA